MANKVNLTTVTLLSVINPYLGVSNSSITSSHIKWDCLLLYGGAPQFKGHSFPKASYCHADYLDSTVRYLI